MLAQTSCYGIEAGSTTSSKNYAKEILIIAGSRR